MLSVPRGLKPASCVANFVAKKASGRINQGDLVVIDGDSCRALNEDDLRNNDLSKMDITMAVSQCENEMVYVTRPRGETH